MDVKLLIVHNWGTLKYVEPLTRYFTMLSLPVGCDAHKWHSFAFFTIEPYRNCLHNSSQRKKTLSGIEVFPKHEKKTLNLCNSISRLSVKVTWN